MPAAGKARSPGRDFRGPLHGGTPEEAKLMSPRDGNGSGPGGLALRQSTLLPSIPFLSFQLLNRLLRTQPSPRETCLALLMHV